MTMQLAPRHPRSAASASPTGPPPTIRIGVSIVLELSGMLLWRLDCDLGLGHHVRRRIDRVVDDGCDAFCAHRLEIEIEPLQSHRLEIEIEPLRFRHES